MSQSYDEQPAETAAEPAESIEEPAEPAAPAAPEVTDPLQVSELGVNLEGIVFEEAGKYEFALYANDQFLQSKPFQVREAAGAPPGSPPGAPPLPPAKA